MLGLAASLLLSGPMSLASSSHRESVARYARAEILQRRLDVKSLSVRTRADYERVLDAYRAVYHGDPASPDAARSIAAVADLLASEARCFHDAKLSHDAIAQWEFLRREYPGSSLRRRGRIEEARIEQQDLHDRGPTSRMHRKFLSGYPHGPVAEQARSIREGVPEIFRRRSEFESTSARPGETLPAGEHKTLAYPLSEAVAEPVAHTAHVPVVTVKAVRHWIKGSSTRVAVDMTGPAPYHAYITKNGQQITLILFGAQPSEALIHSSALGHDGNVRSIRASVLTSNQAELILDLNHAASFSSFVLSNPDRLILDVHANRPADPSSALAQAEVRKDPPERHAAQQIPVGYPSPKPASTDVPQPEVALPSQTALLPRETIGQHSMSRVLGLRIRRIVIDAGHGGYDSGTLGPGGLEEKDISLDVALRLGHLLHQRLGANVIYTRRTDKFVPLGQRTAIANRAHADLFISIHANSSSDSEVRGVETYFLNFTASPDALQVAARENAISNRSVHELSNLVRKITLSDKIDESRVFAGDVQQSLYDGMASGNPGLKNRGVKQAPFMVLIGANMPSILAEISFLTNPDDASELAQPEYRERLAEALCRGVARYVDGMSGVRVAKTAPVEAPAESAESSAE